MRNLTPDPTAEHERLLLACVLQNADTRELTCRPVHAADGRARTCGPAPPAERRNRPGRPDRRAGAELGGDEAPGRSLHQLTVPSERRLLR